MAFEYQFFVRDMRLGFSTNLLISCNLKTHLSEAEDKKSESDFSGKKNKKTKKQNKTKKQKNTKNKKTKNKKQKTKNKNKNKTLLFFLK